MTNENETVAEICHEMHLHEINGQWVNGYEVGRLADRIDAAHKRETKRLRDALRVIAIRTDGLADDTLRGIHRVAADELKGGER